MSGYVRRTPLAEIPVEGKRLGRHIVHDQRSHDYEAERASRIVSVIHRNYGPLLNQGDVGSCTGESLTEAGNMAPNADGRKPPRTQDDAYRVYHEETILEGQAWPPNDPGGSGLEVCKAGKKLGWVKSYRHAFGIQHALEALVKRPVMFGVNWYDSFDKPDPETGIITIKPGAKVRGGHEICADEIDAHRELIGFIQSWGNWGLHGTGKFYIPFKDVDQLLQEQGDATVPIFS